MTETCIVECECTSGGIHRKRGPTSREKRRAGGRGRAGAAEGEGRGGAAIDAGVEDDFFVLP